MSEPAAPPNDDEENAGALTPEDGDTWCTLLKALGTRGPIAPCHTVSPTPLPSSAASERNKQVIAASAAAFFVPGSHVLEIASGYGAHGEHFCQTFAGLRWTSSDRDGEALAVLKARAELTPGLEPPIALDVCRPPEHLPGYDLVFCANMIHIAPWAASEGLFSVAARALGRDGARESGRLLTYGPYRFDGAFTSQSNAEFDGWLKARDPDFGVRDIEALDELAHLHNAAREEVINMPANNHLVVWRFDAVTAAPSPEQSSL